MRSKVDDCVSSLRCLPVGNIDMYAATDVPLLTIEATLPRLNLFGTDLVNPWQNEYLLLWYVTSVVGTAVVLEQTMAVVADKAFTVVASEVLKEMFTGSPILLAAPFSEGQEAMEPVGAVGISDKRHLRLQVEDWLNHLPSIHMLSPHVKLTML